ncbi:MAG: extracellular solute-binding protein [Lachnospiraceae bacterium]|nr:extracellular solute-binding protein [Lachnospiraceae bacterium]
MKKLSNLKRAIALGLAVVMTISMAACNNANGGEKEGGKNGKGDKTVAADPMLAKQYVYRYQDINFGSGSDEDLNIAGARRAGDRVEILCTSYDYNHGDGSQKLQLVSMKNDGTDIKTMSLEKREFTSAESEGSISDGMNPPVIYDGAYVDVMPTNYSYDSTNYYNFCLTADGIYGLANHWMESYTDEGDYSYTNETYVCSWNKADGSLLFMTPIDLSEYQNDESYTYVSRMLSMGDGKFGIMMSGDQPGIITVNADGTLQPIKRFDSSNDALSRDPSFAEKSDGTLYMSYYGDDWSKQYVTTFNPVTGNTGTVYEVPAVARNNGFYNYSEGTTTDLMYSSNDGVYGFNLGDTEVTKIMDYINSDLATYNLNNIVPLDATHFIASYYDQTSYRQIMALFTYVKPEDISDKKVLVYAGVYIDSDSKAAVIRFNKTNTEYRITIDDYSKYNDGEDYTQPYTKLNNDIIAGKMPDILQLDSAMAVDSYISKGMLANIDELIKNDAELSKNEYMDNVFEAFRVKGVLYRVVPSFYIQTWIGKKSLVGDRTSWTMNEVKQAASALNGEKTIFGMGYTRDSFIDAVMNYCGSDFVDVSTGKCNFDNANFVGLLEYAKTLPTEERFDYDDDEFWNNYYKSYQSQYRENRSLLLECYIGDTYNIKYNVKGTIGEDVSYVGFPTEGGAGSYLDSYRSFAISAKSQYIDGAWQYLRFFLTKEYQENEDGKYGYHDGLPIFKDMIRESLNKLTERPYWEDEYGNKEYYDDTYWINDESIVIEPFTQAEVEKLFNFICSVKTARYSDEDVRKIVSEEVDAFFNGSKSAQETATMIQNRVQLYVHENN